MRGRSLLVWIASTLLITACKGAFTTPPEPIEGEGVKPLCGDFGELLSITPMRVTAGAGQLVVLTGSGGTGSFRWSLAENASGAQIDTNTGVYVAGAPNPDLDATSDVILLEDRNCRGEAAATVTVVQAPAITPREVAVRPGESISFVGSGGSGEYTLELVTNASGGSVDGLVYTAGTATGNDVVRLHDAGLGSSSDAFVEVSEDAGLRLATDEWVVPVDSQVAFALTGGSGEHDVAVSGAAVEHVGDGVVRALEPGTAEVTFTDRFTGRTAVARVEVVAPREAERRHPGDRSEEHVVAGGEYDIDGDGHFDAVVGMPSASEGWWSSGVVRIYAGTSGGLDPSPVRVIGGTSRDQELGHAVRVADVDGDGLVDLLVGARRADALRVDVGALYLYRGVEDGFFSEAPTQQWYGQSSYDLFGSGVEVCDFNADGAVDIAVATPYGQEADGEPDQGVVRVFLARPDGASRFLSGSDVTVAGWVFEDGAWAPERSLRFGDAIASGDFDGDGACDLAVTSRGPTQSQFESGAVTLYRGRPGEGADRGGLQAEPSLFWARADGEDDNTYFGRTLTMGDVNGDGLADVVASRYLHDGAAGGDSGGIYVLYGGRTLGDAVTAITDIGAADWSVEGARDQDRTGNGLALADLDGDRRADILSGDSRAGVMDAELSRPGIVRVWRGGVLGDTPTREYVGDAEGARFGIGVGAIGDLDGDGWRDILVFAPYHDTSETEDDDRGALFLQPSGGGARVELTLGRTPSGQHVGASMTWIGDLDGDGFPELAVGAPEADVTGLGLNVGVVRIYGGTATGTRSTPSQVLSGFTGHSDSDYFGYALAPGDFDGDGRPDLAVVARYGDLGTLSAERYAVGEGCSDSRYNTGAVFVFRGTAEGGLTDEPAFVAYGPQQSQLVSAVAGDLDVNDDGRDDLLLGGYHWDTGETNAGGFMVVHGRAAVAGKISAICTPAHRAYGGDQSEYRGWALAAVGDLNADGCDEYAVGSPAADPGGDSSAGEVRVVFPPCGTAHPSRQVVRLYGVTRSSSGGRTLAGGVDADGRGKPDLLIGLPRYRDERGEVGRVVLVTGEYIVSLLGRGRSGPFIDRASRARLTVDGMSAGAALGDALALSTVGGRALAVLGAPRGAAAGRVDTGGVLVFEVNASGFAAAPRLRVSGEIIGESDLGAAVSAASGAGGAFIAAGAPFSTSGPSTVRAYVGDGASYAFTMGAP